MLPPIEVVVDQRWLVNNSASRYTDMTLHMAMIEARVHMGDFLTHATNF